MGKMSDVQRYADAKGVDPRTVRRWSKAKKIPAKYGTRSDGHRFEISRRILPDLIAREKSLRDCRAYFPGDKRAFEYALLKQRFGRMKLRMKNKKLRTKKLRSFFGSDTTRAKRFLVSIALARSYKPDPDATAALSRPYADLRVAAAWLYRYHRRVTREMLARHVGISCSKLYRRCPGIMRMIKHHLQAFDPTPPTGLTTPTERDPLNKTWLGAAKMKPKENLNWRHDGGLDYDD
ncbi:MAG: hypothetical protein DME88_07900 [Verrucomicrobia bacterium]|nr:MAG: hypothetical protein DME88_07900 [Verrucomicrobiota bacterium]